ncbi:MAG: hypothetical protein LQ340_002739 [Diploschistes diacapsis]|nr:MAG: hypothetical protein LQ340_002739 [Diploschistes diacapsis]
MSVGTRSQLPTQARNQIHPKRVSRAESVCIRKSPLHSSEKSARADSDSLSVASNIAANGEDPSICHGSRLPKDGGSARTWFIDSNKNVSGEGSARFIGNDDPPFFLKKKSSSESASRDRFHPSASSNGGRRPCHADSFASQNYILENSNEDFRSVIDDLTIENRRLRRKLQKYEELHCGKLQNDKLFEIRVHGLPASKKRRLERALQDFASSMGDAGEEDVPSAFAQRLSHVPSRRPTPRHQPSSSGTSNSRPLDSAYVSMSAFGGNSESRLQKADPSLVPGKAKANDQNVRSYLQSISQRLLPKHSPVMTEQAKKQLVVKRLEQLYTGSRDSSNTHSQSRQQQEISQSAANADRRASEACGHQVTAEGSREAKIFPTANRTSNHIGASPAEKSSDEWNPKDTSTGSSPTPSQRPTRPLDLDPSRAQNPEENVQYIKHLGFDSPELDYEKRSEGDEGWIYLNLLISMAQLHTLNVTPDFVRDSIHDIGATFELSTDGSRIRWKGGNEVTKLTIDTGGESSEHSSESYPYELGVGKDIGHSKPSKPSTEVHSGISGNVQTSKDPYSGTYKSNLDRQRPLLLNQTLSEDPYQYRPIFYHSLEVGEDGYRSFDGEGSSVSATPMQSTSALDADGAPYGNAINAAIRSNFRKGVDHIIFYNRARFYTDLSKDEENTPYNCPLYDKDFDGVVGCSVGKNNEERRSEVNGLVSKSLDPGSVNSWEKSTSTPIITGLAEGLGKSCKSPSSEGEEKSFEVSGLGGVVPGDNFSIKVRVEHRQLLQESAVETKILSTRKLDLLPSALPPPSYALLPFSSESISDDGSGSEGDSDDKMEDVQHDVENVGRFVPSRFLHTFSSNTTRHESSGDQESDDSSIDLLAHARQLEPEAVAAREREFEENASLYEKGTEVVEVDPPASSIVATVGEQSNMDDSADGKKEKRVYAVAGRKRPAGGGKEWGKVKQRRATPGT